MMTAIKLSNISFRYGEKQALNDVSLSIEQGKFCALLGPNGAGKSTLFALLTRLFTTPEGVIEIAGQDLRRSPRAALAKIGVVFQQSTLDMDLSIAQNLRYFAALHGVTGREAAKRIDGALDLLSMRARAHESVRALNGGHKRRAEIARALIHDPAVLLLDEATVGLDLDARTSITKEVHALAEDQGKTVLWATHLADEITPQDDVAILHRGQIIAHDSYDTICAGRDLATVFLERTKGEPA